MHAGGIMVATPEGKMFQRTSMACDYAAGRSPFGVGRGFAAQDRHPGELRSCCSASITMQDRASTRLPILNILRMAAGLTFGWLGGVDFHTTTSREDKTQTLARRGRRRSMRVTYDPRADAAVSRLGFGAGGQVDKLSTGS